ncbi:MAG: type IV pilus secretin PilQ [Candidatus Omnitrophica bacterium]|nr:type IV pilus secretin PilQ [Candidatus Omnitrophota bacterium]
MFKRAIVLSMVVGLMAASVGAQEQAAPQPKEVPVTQEGNVSFDFRDADIQNVFRILSFKSGVNIVAGPEVTGVVTIKLDDVPWQQALDVILETYGYAYEKKGNIISVTTIANLKQRRENAALLAEQEALETKIFTLNFGKASEIIESISKMKSERGSINFDERTNTVIVTDISSRLTLMANVIETLDKTTPQVLIEAKIVETDLNDSENLGIDWTVQASINGAERGISWPFKTGPTQDRFVTGFFEPPTGYPANTADYIYEETARYGTLSFTEFQAVLELLKSRTDTNILSNPKIVTLDNRPAQIQVGTEYPIPSFGANTETGQLQTTGIEYQNIGINFEVTPHVNSAGYVTLEIKPEVSEFAGNRTIQSTEVPLIGTERVVTNVMVKDGDTLVIAGLLTDKLTDVKKKVPFLGDLPVLGLVFRKSEKTIVKTDLIIFLTPHIITPEIPKT